MESFPSNSKNETGMPTIPTLIQYITEVLSKAIKQDKNINDIDIRKEKQRHQYLQI